MGHDYWKNTFFLPDRRPRYYSNKILPLDMKCSSQAIDTLVFFHDIDPESVPLAMKMAEWTVASCQHAGPNRPLLLPPLLGMDGQQDSKPALRAGHNALCGCRSV